VCKHCEQQEYPEQQQQQIIQQLIQISKPNAQMEAQLCLFSQPE
jgi:hypothetical protein